MTRERRNYWLGWLLIGLLWAILGVIMLCGACTVHLHWHACDAKPEVVVEYDGPDEPEPDLEVTYEPHEGS